MNLFHAGQSHYLCFRGSALDKFTWPEITRISVRLYSYGNLEDPYHGLTTWSLDGNVRVRCALIQGFVHFANYHFLLGVAARHRQHLYQSNRMSTHFNIF